MTFAWPVFLWGLALVPVAVMAYVIVQRRRSRYVRQFTSWNLLPNLVPRAPGWRRHVPVALYLLAMAGLLTSLARPQATLAVPREESTIVLVMDTSVSMSATDVQPTRLAAANAAAKRFLDILPPSLRVSLVSFAAGAQVHSGPTTDRQALRQALDAFRAEGGTAMGEALDLAVGLAAAALEGDAAEATPQTTRPSPTPTPSNEPSPVAILLLSDGANTAGQVQPLDAAAEAERHGIPVYTIALGTAAGTIESPEAPGSGQRMAVPPDEATLRQIAELTGGQFFSAPTAAALQSVYENLGSRVGFTEAQQDVTGAFAGAGALLLAIGGALALLWFNRFP
jgi:Ca-activated chloride channel family protein